MEDTDIFVRKWGGGKNAINFWMQLLKEHYGYLS